MCTLRLNTSAWLSNAYSVVQTIPALCARTSSSLINRASLEAHQTAPPVRSPDWGIPENLTTPSDPATPSPLAPYARVAAMRRVLQRIAQIATTKETQSTNEGGYCHAQSHQTKTSQSSYHMQLHRIWCAKSPHRGVDCIDPSSGGCGLPVPRLPRTDARLADPPVSVAGSDSVEAADLNRAAIMRVKTRR